MTSALPKTIKTTNWSVFSTIIQNSIPGNPIIDSTRDIDDAITKFTASIVTTLNQASKAKIIQGPPRKLPPEIVDKIKLKNRWRKFWQMTFYPPYKLLFTKLQNEIREDINEYDNNSWKELLESLNPEDNSLFEFNRKLTKKFFVLPPIFDSDRLKYTPLGKANAFLHSLENSFQVNPEPYGTLDAYCLLMIYEKIYPVLKKHGLDLNKVLQTKQTPFKAQKPKAVVQSKLSNEPLAIKDFKVVVDTTVGGVTKYLRLLGADVVTLNEGDDHMRAVQLSGYVPPGMCFCVDNLLMAKQQVSQIWGPFSKFGGARIPHIFSRCPEESDDDTVPGDKDKTINDIPVTNEDGHQISGSSVQKSFLQFEVADSEDEDDLDSIYY
ncbi:hypothetical protein HNY73_007784 [Argiope bruennichi]|uniref:Uncharacterized protein n=1 Tax=Argiope bruennichi TaxID=94029 RepID=A0A8T0FKJ4_ARGBR|nr:hypothetical protein HNY73_007784 [Argiope bruennichi]